MTVRAVGCIDLREFAELLHCSLREIPNLIAGKLRRSDEMPKLRFLVASGSSTHIGFVTVGF